MKATTRILSMLLCIMMILGIVPIQVFADANKYIVTFDMNYNGGKAVTVEVEEGKTVEKQKAPIRFAHNFAKWTVDEAGKTEFDFDTPITEDITLYAQWTVNYAWLGSWEGTIQSGVNQPEDDDEEQEDDDEKQDEEDTTPNTVNFGIGKFSFDENQSAFFFNYNATSESYLLFSILNDEETEVLYTDIISLETGRDILTLYYLIDDSFTLPKYFYAQAVIVDKNGNELCNSVYFCEKSSKYEKLNSLTPEDFDSEKVIIMEADNTEKKENFAVVAEDVLLINCNSDLTLVINDDTTYCLSGDIASLGLDETTKKCVIVDGDNTYAINVGSVTVKEDKIIILPEDVLTGEESLDFYDYIRLKVNGSEDEAATQSKVRRVSRKQETVVEPLKKISLDDFFNLELKHPETGNTLAVTVEGEIGFAVDFCYAGPYNKLDLEPYCSLRHEFLRNTSLTFTLKGSDFKKEAEWEAPIAKDLVLYTAPGFNVTLSITAPVTLKAEGHLSVKETETLHTQSLYTTKVGGSNTSESGPTKRETYEAGGKITTKVGAKIEVAMNILDEVAKVSVSAESGVGASLATTPIDINPDYQHVCYACLEGEIFLYCTIEGNLSLRLPGVEKFEYTLFKFDIKDIEDFDGFRKTISLSVDNPVDSLFGGKLHFAVGKCQNKKYAVNIGFGTMTPERGVTITGTHMCGDSLYAIPAVDEADTFLYPGDYKVAVVQNDITYSREFQVVDKPVEIDLLDYMLKCNITDSRTGLPLYDAKVKVYSKGTGEVAYEGIYTENFKEQPLRFSMGNNDYIFSVEKEGYQTYTEFLSNTDKDGIFEINAKVDPVFYQISGFVLDSTGSAELPIAGVTATLFDENSIQYGTAESDSTGKFTLYRVFPGKYTLVVNCPGYTTTDGNSEYEIDLTVNENGQIYGVNGEDYTTINLYFLKGAFRVTHSVTHTNILAKPEMMLYNGKGVQTWTVESAVEWDVSSVGDWFTINKNHGNAGIDELKITVTGFTTDENVGTVDFLVDGTEYSVILKQKAYPVSGTLVDEEYNRIYNATVTIYNDEYSSQPVQVTDGTFSIKMPSGNYDVKIVADGYEEKITPVGKFHDDMTTDMGNIILMKDIQLDGKTIGFLIGDSGNNLNYSSLYADASAGDALSKAVYNRNKAVEEKHDVTLTYQVDTPDNAYSTLQADVFAGYDKNYIAAIGFSGISRAAYAGYLHNLNTSEFSDLNLEKPYWNQNFNDAVAYSDDYYLITGDLAFDSLGGLYGVYVNESLCSANIPQMVTSGEWTFDKMNALSTTYYTNTDEKAVAVDDFSPDAYAIGMNVQQIGKDKNNIPQFLSCQDEAYEYYNTAYTKVKSLWDSGMVYSTGSTSAISEFANGKVAFGIGTIHDAKQYLGKLTDAYYMVPMPKYDMYQTKYYTPMVKDVMVFGIPYLNTVANGDKVMILESLAAETAASVKSTFYSYAFTDSYRGKDGMIDRIRNNIAFSFAEYIGDYFSPWFSKGIETDADSYIAIEAGSRKAMEKILDKYITSFEN